MLGAGALGRPRGMVWRGRRGEGSGWGTHVYLWCIHFDIWQNQYNIVKFKNKRKKIVYVVTCTIVVFYRAIGLILQSVFILIGSSAYDNIKDIQSSAKLMSQKCLKYFKTFRIYIIVIFS